MGLFDFFKKKEDEVFHKEGIIEIENIDLDIRVIESCKERFIAFDVETTGLSSTEDRIVELGAVLFIDGKPVDRFSSLVNPNVPISASASSVNHITNDMLRTAPKEKNVYKDFVSFLDDALSGQTYMCAHNARFDFGFLSNTLSRLGYDAKIEYLDTLSLSRCFLKGLDNYQQKTIEQHFGLVNKAAHRAEADAEMCGQIFYNLLELAEVADKEERKQQEKLIPNDNELEVCAMIQKLLSESGKDISWLRFRKNSSGYVDAACLYSFVKFKFSKKGKYMILNKDACKIDTGLPFEPCPASEGGTANVRIYFSNPNDIVPYRGLIVREFQEAYRSLKDYANSSSYAKKEAIRWRNSILSITDDDIKRLLSIISQKKYDPIDSGGAKPIITREMVLINAVNNRCPLSEIKNLGDWEKGYKEGFRYFERAEDARKNDRLEEAIYFYDQARYNGYEAPALYEGYAMTYHKMKDYENEIVIIDEFLTRETYGKAGKFEARRDAAINALYAKQEAARKTQLKAIEQEKKQRERAEKKQIGDKEEKHRVIYQMDDSGNIIAEYDSLSQAVKVSGVNSKSIRDALNGVQKHAGGYCWKYKDQLNQDE